MNTTQTKSEQAVDIILGTLLERLSSALAFDLSLCLHPCSYTSYYTLQLNEPYYWKG